MNVNSVAIGAALLFSVAVAGCGGGGASPPTPAGEEEGPAQEAGSLSSARSMSVSQTHYESVVEMLRGQVPGLEILDNGTGNIEVRIRGMNQSLQTNAEGASVSQQPLVVVDGVPSPRPAGEALLSLNPQDVATITVLKDISSTSIYGTKGANGVILVRLKRRS